MPDSGPRKTLILLLEDNPADVTLLSRALKKAGLSCELMVFEDGAEALAFVRRQGKYANAPLPDLTVLDLNVPKNGGIEVLAALRKNALFSSIPVVVLSSSSSPRERVELQRLGVTRFLTKPPELDEFMKIGAELKALLDGNEKSTSCQA